VALTEARGRPRPAEDAGAGTLTAADLRLGSARPRRALTTRRQKLIAATVVLVALGFLLYKGLTDSLAYYLTAKQAVAERAKLGTEDFRIQGTVQPGLREAGPKLSFTIASGDVRVAVVSTGSPPQLFRVGMPVVLNGHWQGDVFSSDQIMVQHGSTYSPAASRTVAHAASTPSRPRGVK
jgi:cytochrome c-type biogenesis protein CcmE